MIERAEKAPIACLLRHELEIGPRARRAVPREPNPRRCVVTGLFRAYATFRQPPVFLQIAAEEAFHDTSAAATKLVGDELLERVCLRSNGRHRRTELDPTRAARIVLHSPRDRDSGALATAAAIAS